MSIAITEDHRSLAETVSSFAQKRDARGAGAGAVERRVGGTTRAVERARRPRLAGLHLPEQYGGSGYTLEELVIVVEELGRAVTPGPFVPTVIASAVPAVVGDEAIQTRLLPGLADGSVTGAVALGGSVTVANGTASGSAGVVLGGG